MGVAGVDAPAFVEIRNKLSVVRVALPPEEVSPGLTLRPSGREKVWRVSPGLTLRPSLSARACHTADERHCAKGVAGVDAPAFVERLRVDD